MHPSAEAPTPGPGAPRLRLHQRLGRTVAGELWTARVPVRGVRHGHGAGPGADTRVELLTRTIAADRAAIAVGVEELWALDLPLLFPPVGLVATDHGPALRLGVGPDAVTPTPATPFPGRPDHGHLAARRLVSAVAGLHARGRVHGSIGPATLVARLSGTEAPMIVGLCLSATTALNSRPPEDDVEALVALVTPWVDLATATRLRSRLILGEGLAGLAAALEATRIPSGTPPPPVTAPPRPSRRHRLVLPLAGAAAVAALAAAGGVLAVQQGPASTPPGASGPPSPAPTSSSGPRLGSGFAASGLSFSFPPVHGGGGVEVTCTWQLATTTPDRLTVQLDVTAPAGLRSVVVRDSVAPQLAAGREDVDLQGRPGTVSGGSDIVLAWQLALGADGHASTSYQVHLSAPVRDDTGLAVLVAAEQLAQERTGTPSIGLGAPAAVSPSSAPLPPASPSSAPRPPVTAASPAPSRPPVITGTVRVPH